MVSERVLGLQRVLVLAASLVVALVLGELVLVELVPVQLAGLACQDTSSQAGRGVLKKIRSQKDDRYEEIHPHLDNRPLLQFLLPGNHFE